MQVNPHGIARKPKGFNSMANVVSEKSNSNWPPTAVPGWRNAQWYSMCIYANLFIRRVFLCSQYIE